MTFRTFLAGILLAASLAAAPAAEARQLSGPGTFLTLSDVHFNPFADPSLLPALEAAEAKDWLPILEGSTNTPAAAYGQDAPWPLVKSALEAMRKADPHPDFIVFPGDIIVHGAENTYMALSKTPTHESWVSFVNKIVQFFAGQLSGRFPGTPILPVLGNNDSDCGDYAVQPNGPFLAAYAQTFKGLVGKGGDAFAASVPVGGYYTIPHPTVPHLRVVGLNDNFMAPSFQNTCGGGESDPAATELDWLKDQLAEAQKAGDRVWVLMHIPVGMDVYDSNKAGCGQPPQPAMKEPYGSTLAAMLAGASPRLRSVWSGHTHMDDSRVLSGKVKVLDKILPGISPVFGNNPAFQVYAYDHADGRMRDYQTWMTADFGATWTVEYDYGRAYGATRVDGAALARIVGQMPANAIRRGHYQTYYGVSKAGMVTNANWQADWCGITNIDAQGFSACMCRKGP